MWSLSTASTIVAFATVLVITSGQPYQRGYNENRRPYGPYRRHSDYPDYGRSNQFGSSFHGMSHFKQTSGMRHNPAHYWASRSENDECNSMMKDPHGRISPPMKKLMCKMYDDWHRDMLRPSDWNPTSGQKHWFESLTIHSHPGGRFKRQTRSKAIRKEYRSLTDAERNAFHQALLTLKNDRMDGMGKYDIFVRYHQASESPGAHFGPAFYGWHRELLLRVENALREIDPTVALPYWDSNLDYELGNEIATETMMWTPTFLGNGDGYVTTGPFANWPLAFPSLIGRTRLYRNLTNPPEVVQTEPMLMSDDAILSILDAQNLRDISWNVDNSFESHHGGVHNWVGGVMAELPHSPNDPAFLLLHTFVDCLWEQMRTRQRARNPPVDTRFDYPNDTVTLGVGSPQPNGGTPQTVEESFQYALNEMRPFGPLRNIDGLKDEYFSESYECQPSPVCSESAPDCGTPYLFCNRATYKCVPTLQLGTPCARFADSKPCHAGECCNGVCRSTCTPNTAQSRPEVNRVVPRPPPSTTSDTSTRTSPTNERPPSRNQPGNRPETPQINTVRRANNRPPDNAVPRRQERIRTVRTNQGINRNVSGARDRRRQVTTRRFPPFPNRRNFADRRQTDRSQFRTGPNPGSFFGGRFGTDPNFRFPFRANLANP